MGAFVYSWVYSSILWFAARQVYCTKKDECEAGMTIQSCAKRMRQKGAKAQRWDAWHNTIWRWMQKNRGLGFNNDGDWLMWYIVPQVCCRNWGIKLIHPCTMRRTSNQGLRGLMFGLMWYESERSITKSLDFNTDDFCLMWYIVPQVYYRNGGIKLIHHAQLEWQDRNQMLRDEICVAIDITKGMGFNNNDYCLMWYIVPKVCCRNGGVKLIHQCIIRMTNSQGLRGWMFGRMWNENESSRVRFGF